MEFDTNVVAAAVGTLLFVSTSVVALRIRKVQRNKIEEDNKKEVPQTLDELSKIWARGQQTGKIHIKDLAPIWKKDAGNQHEAFERDAFKNQKIEDFFTKHIETSVVFGKSVQHKKVCYKLLQILEKEGDCPSVVNVSNDAETSWDATTYNLLGKTSLIDHTIHVAETIIELALEEEILFLIPDAIVAALAHDIGKIPSNRNNLYAMGEHPLSAGKVLSGIETFKDLSKKDKILKAIKSHHKQPDELLANMLKKADQKARQDELDQAIEQTGDEMDYRVVVDNTNDEKNSDIQEVSTEKQRRKIKLTGGSARKADADIYGTDYGKEKALGNFGKKINISTWFDYDTFIEELKPAINHLKDANIFTAFSMPDGYVFIHPESIMEVTKSIASTAGQLDVVQMEDRTSRQNILLAVVDFCRAQNAIPENLIDRGYFGGYYNITTRNGKTFKGFFTPFHAEIFGQIGELETRKKGMLSRFASINRIEK